jgi:hypothetical protein
MRPRTRFRNRLRIQSAGRATFGSWATIVCFAVTPRYWPTSSVPGAATARADRRRDRHRHGHSAEDRRRPRLRPRCALGAAARGRGGLCRGVVRRRRSTPLNLERRHQRLVVIPPFAMERGTGTISQIEGSRHGSQFCSQFSLGEAWRWRCRMAPSKWARF